MNRIFPENVKTVGITATSKSPDKAGLEQAIRLIQAEGISVHCAEHIFSAGEEDYFAADSAVRTEDFNSLLEDECIDLILAARGGYGSAYLAKGIKWDLLRRRNLPVLGYSDVTALHMAMIANHAGIPVACTMAQQLPVLDEFSRKSMNRALHIAAGKDVAPEQYPLQTVAGSAQDISAPLIPANLAVLTSLCGTDLLPDFSGKLLLLEDVDEEPRKIDRMLLQLELCGILNRTAGIIFGQFSGECGTEAERNRIFRRFAERNHGTPFWYGANFGHALPTLAFTVGQTVTIRPDGTMIC